MNFVAQCRRLGLVRLSAFRRGEPAAGGLNLLGTLYFRAVEEKELSIAEHFERISAKIPWYRKQFIAARLFILLAVITAIGAYVLVKVNRYTEHQLLTETVWCADTIMVNGVTRLQPNSLGIRNDFSRGRQETFQLQPDGKAILPGFNSEPVHAKWRTEQIYIEIYDADTFGHIYNNVYEYYLTPEFLKLVGADIVISGSRNGAYQ